MKQNPAICIPAYNRGQSLSRLLISLNKASYPSKVKLIISIDQSDNPAVSKIAEDFQWAHGKKYIVNHKEHFGLKNHVLHCGNYAIEEKELILLEDDTYVSPYFYYFACEAVQYYENDERICGISLYNNRVNEYSKSLFYPLVGNSDIFFGQIPASWAQAWTKSQWQNFIKSIDTLPNVILPRNVSQWADSSSWKKLFYKYMVSHDKYYIYPYTSFVTNFGESGQHHSKQTNVYQNQLSLKNKGYLFESLNRRSIVYDAHNEISQVFLKDMNHEMKHYDFACDFYDSYQLKDIDNSYTLSIKNCKNPIFSYGNDLIPPELNVIFNIKGDFFNFGKTEDFLEDVNEQKRESLTIALSKVDIYGIKIANKMKLKQTRDYRLGNQILRPIRYLKNIKSKLFNI